MRKETEKRKQKKKRRLGSQEPGSRRHHFSTEVGGLFVSTETMTLSYMILFTQIIIDYDLWYLILH